MLFRLLYKTGGNSRNVVMDTGIDFQTPKWNAVIVYEYDNFNFKNTGGLVPNMFIF